jgi:hypothetical protein
MNRRGFLSTLIGGVAATAAVRSFPFRVFSFPSEVALAKVPRFAPLLAPGLVPYPVCNELLAPKAWWLPLQPRSLASPTYLFNDDHPLLDAYDYTPLELKTTFETEHRHAEDFNA